MIFGLYASGRRDRPTIQWFNDQQKSIDKWNESRPPGCGVCSDEWMELCYHQTVTLLHRPCPGNPQPTRESLVRALQGSNATMRLYKEIYRKGLSDFGAPKKFERRLMCRLVVDVSSVHIGCDVSQLTLASIPERLETGAILRRRSARHAGVHERYGGSCL